MPMIATPRGRTRQPPNPTRLSSSPLARGLVYAVADLTAPFEAAAGRQVGYTDIGTAPTLSSTGGATAIRIAGSGFRSLSDPAGALRIFSGPMTVAMFARVSSLDSSWGALWTIKDASSANAIWACQRGGSSGDINMEITGGAGCSFTGAVAAVANNAPQMIVVSRTGVTASDTASLWAGGSKFTATMSGGAAGTVTSCVLNVGASRWNSSIASGDFGSVLVWNRSLSDSEVASLRENPWQLFAPVRRPVFFAAGGAPAELAGAGVAGATGTGALTTAIPILGAAVVSATGSGALTTAIPLAGAAATVSATGSGNLSTVIRLDGAALAAVAGAGDLTAQITLSGAALASVIGSGALTTAPAGLAGDAAGGATGTGTLSTSIPLAGAAAVSVVGSGGLVTAIPLAGGATAAVTGSGDLTITLSGLSGAALVAVAGSGALVTSIVLSGAAVARAVGTGVLSGTPLRASAWRTHRAAARVRNAMSRRRVRWLVGGGVR